MKNDFLIWFYEQKNKYVSYATIEAKFKKQTDDLIKQYAEFFVFSSQHGLYLKSKYKIGILDLKEKVAFLLQDGDDIKLQRRDVGSAMDRDLVLVESFARTSRIIAVLRRSLTQIVTQVRKNKNYVTFVPEHDYGKVINVSNYPKTLVDGHVVLLKVDNISPSSIICSYVETIGHKNDPDISILKIIYGYNWPLEFDQATLDEVEQIVVDHEYEKQTRKDMTEQLVVTIDGADAKDLDDAIFVQKTKDGYFVSIHIADVSYFVKEGSHLDISAYDRATSSYLADRVIPMIPHAISNELCSLNADSIKYTMSCDVKLSNDLKVINHKIYPAIIQSKGRLTYDQVNDLIHNNVSVGDEKIDLMLRHANELGLRLKKFRQQHGAIDFHSSELKFDIDLKTNEIIDVCERHTDQAEGLIESLMVLANEVVATHFVKNNLPGIYRVHEKPDEDKLARALETVAVLGFASSEKSADKKLQSLTRKADGTNYEFIVNMVLLRAMQRAKYYEHPIGHFGLGLKYYSHFTSPIRRYPDLILHRMIRDLVFKSSNNKKKTYYESIMHSICEHTSAQERKAVSMERDVSALKSAEYMQDKIGQEFKAIIISLSQAGFFVKLDCGIEGFMPLRRLNTFLGYDQQNLSFYTLDGKTYRLGDRVDVTLIDVDILKREITFILSDLKGGANENINPKQKSEPRLSPRGQIRGGNQAKRIRSKVTKGRKSKH